MASSFHSAHSSKYSQQHDTSFFISAQDLGISKLLSIGTCNISWVGSVIRTMHRQVRMMMMRITSDQVWRHELISSGFSIQKQSVLKVKK